MQPFIVTNHNKTGVAAGGYFLHKVMDTQDILLFDFFSQGRNKRNFFGLYFCARAHFLIKLPADIDIIISAQ